MSNQTLWKQRQRFRQVKRRRIGQVRRRLGFEPLEDRRLLAAVTWTGAGDGISWSDANNWLRGGIVSAPIDGDDVVVPDMPGSVNIQFNVSVNLNSLNMAEALTILGGSLSIDNASQIDGGMSLVGGYIAGEGVLTLHGDSEWSDGRMYTPAGKTVIASGATLNVNGATAKYLARILENAGTINYDGSNWAFLNQSGSIGTVNNLIGGVFNAIGEGDFGTSGPSANHTINNSGTFIRSGEGVTTVSGIPFNNNGSIDVQGGLLQLAFGGTTSGMSSIKGGVVQLTAGTYTLEDGAVILGTGTLEITNGAVLNVAAGNSTVNHLHLAFDSAFVLGDGMLTLQGDSQWSAGRMLGEGKIVIDDDAKLTISGNSAKYLGRILENSGTIEYVGTSFAFGPGDGVAGTINNLAGATFHANGNNQIGTNWTAEHAINNAGAFIRSGEGVTTVSGIPFNNNGSIRVEQGTLQLINGTTAQFDDTYYLILRNDTTVHFPGGLIGTTTNADLFAIQGSVTIAGGSILSPSPLEVMGRDVGPITAGYHRNFAYDRLQLVSAYVRLQDDSDNAAGDGVEALYVNTLVVPAGSTLDLNGFNVYARTTEIAGTLLNGIVTMVPEGGILTLGVPVSGTISVPQEIDEWSFYGRTGRSVAVLANPMTTLQQVKIEVLNPFNVVIGTASSSFNGESIELLGIELPEDGVYRVLVSAAATAGNNVGNYRLVVFDATVDEYPMNLDQRHIGSLESPYSSDRWTFTSAAEQSLRFHWINSNSPFIRFSLTGPDGWVGFEDINTDSEVLVTPTAGEYVLEAISHEGVAGNYAFTMARLNAIELTLGEPYAGSLLGTGEAQMFAVELTEPSPLTIYFDGSDVNKVQVFARVHAPATRQQFDSRNENKDSLENVTSITFAAPGTWYILVYGAAVSSPGPFTLRAESSKLIASSVMPSVYGANTNTVLAITGAGFVPGTTVELVRNGNTLLAEAVQIDAFDRLTARFNLIGQAEGIYDLRLSHPEGDIAVLEQSFTITPTGEGIFSARIVAPWVAGPSAPATIYVEYSNTGNAALISPVLTLQSGDLDNSDRPLLTLDHNRLASGFWSSGIPDGFANSVQIYATGALPGLLLPGESFSVPVYYAGLQQPFIELDGIVEFQLLSRRAEETTPIDWDEFLGSAKPSWITDEAWALTIANLQAEMGTTWGDYVRRLSQSATYLSQLGTNLTSAQELYGFEFRQAVGLNPLGDTVSIDASIPTPNQPLQMIRKFAGNAAERYRSGWLGYGWSTPWEIEAFEEGHIESSISGGQYIEEFILDAVVIRRPNGSEQSFMPDRRNPNRFLRESGESATLRSLTIDGTVGGSRYELTEANGDISRFYAFGDLKGRLEYTLDINGNRVDLVYPPGATQPAEIVHSSGVSLILSYDAQGRLANVTDSMCRVIFYSYDEMGHHLVEASGPAGTVTYAYYINTDAAREHALQSITDPSGVRQHFEYDARGRVSATYLDANLERLDFSYSETGQITTTDATGRTQLQYFNHRGQVARTEDATGAYVLYTYDTQGRLTARSNSQGRSQTFKRNRDGQLLSFTDENGHTSEFKPGGPLNQPLAFVDALKNTTLYEYDNTGRLVNTIYADGSTERLGYDNLGNVISLVNRRGQTTQYEFNGFGKVILETLPDGSTVAYQYDSRQRLVEVSDVHGITRFEYDDGDRLTRVEYPNGRWLAYEYDAAGRRTSLADHSGFTTLYTFDSAGRLSELRDATDALIVHYSYDSAGRLVREDKGNGSYSLYTYDAIGNLIGISHRAPDDSVNSFFEYQYNVSGQRTGMTTQDGVWSYTYDLTGQITSAVFVSVNPEIPDQDLQYRYDALGNRVQTVTNGIVRNYTTNALNQYTQSDDVVYAYDRNGNLIEEVGPNGTRRFTYNSKNQLIRVVTPTETTEYEYDAFGYRTASVLNGDRTEYLLDLTGLVNVIAEYDGSGTRRSSFLHGQGLEGVVKADDWHFYDFDAIGSTVGVVDNFGTYSNSYSYDPFGNVILNFESIENPFEFVGELGVMTETNELVFMRARYYEPGSGRFTSTDPLLLGAGDPNLYRYSWNAPLSFIDPSGQSSSWSAMYNYLRDPEKYRNNRPRCIPGFPGFGMNPETINALNDTFGSDSDNPCTPEPPPPPPPGPPGGPQPPDDIKDPPMGRAKDPNEKFGASGFGPEGFIPSQTLIPYRVNFENLGSGSDPVPTQPATAPAQMVVVTDQLTEHLDWSTVQFTEFGFGDFKFVANGQYHFEVVPVAYDGIGFEVEVEMTFNALNGQLRAVFTSVDPDTQLPPDVLTGFLPPEDGTGIGQGYIGFTARPKAGLPTGTEIRNIALIIFDGQDIIATNQVDPQDPSAGTSPDKEALSTIDSGAPISSVQALPAQSYYRFDVSWSGVDDVGGSGLAYYDVFVATNEPTQFVPWIEQTTDTTATFVGQPGLQYYFYVLATDNVGNQELAPLTYQATTLIAELAVVNQRSMFYANAPGTNFGSDGLANAAIDSTRQALLPGQSASIANYSNYQKGLNGIAIDVDKLLSDELSATDFQFDVWNGIDAGGFFATYVVPTSIQVLAVDSLESRIKLVFPDFNPADPSASIHNTWLRITVRANANTGLLADDVFYFGNAIADMYTGNIGSPTTVRVNASDTAAVRLNQSPGINSVGITNFYDVNKDGRVNATDTAIVRLNQSPAVIRFFDAPGLLGGGAIGPKDGGRGRDGVQPPKEPDGPQLLRSPSGPQAVPPTNPPAEGEGTSDFLLSESSQWIREKESGALRAPPLPGALAPSNLASIVEWPPLGIDTIFAVESLRDILTTPLAEHPLRRELLLP